MKAKNLPSWETLGGKAIANITIRRIDVPTPRSYLSLQFTDGTALIIGADGNLITAEYQE